MIKDEFWDKVFLVFKLLFEAEIHNITVSLDDDKYCIEAFLNCQLPKSDAFVQLVSMPEFTGIETMTSGNYLNFEFNKLNKESEK